MASTIGSRYSFKATKEGSIPIFSTIGLPMTIPSVKVLRFSTSSTVLIPKPVTTGLLLNFFIAPSFSEISSRFKLFEPVMPL